MGGANEYRPIKEIDLENAISQDCVCPFCKESDFDLPGLKHHLTIGWCEKFNDVEIIK